jgi:hypothetical protein
LNCFGEHANVIEQNQVDFITNASFWNEGGCIVLEGTGQKLMSKGSSSGSQQP